LSRAGFAETREADAELVPKDGTRAAINTNTHAVRFIFGSMERNMERWYQQLRSCSRGKKLRYGRRD
jgi:hypothetical protein